MENLWGLQPRPSTSLLQPTGKIIMSFFFSFGSLEELSSFYLCVSSEYWNTVCFSNQSTTLCVCVCARAYVHECSCTWD